MKQLPQYIIIVLIGVLIWSVLHSNKSNIDMNIELAEYVAPSTPVRTTELTPSSPQRVIKTAGIVKTNDELILMSTAQGNVTNIRAQEGDKLMQGDIIAQVDDRYLREDHRLAQSALQKAQKDYDRFKVLADSNAITQRQFEQVELGLINATTRFEMIDHRLKDSYIRAPWPGKIDKLFIKKGSLVGPGVPICQIVNNQDILINFTLAPEQLTQVSPGDTVQITEAEFQDLIGIVTKVNLKKDHTGNYWGQAVLSGSKVAQLQLDMTLSAKITSSSEESEKISIPATAVVSQQGKKGVFVAENGKSSFIQLVLGDQIDGRYSVPRGLNTGQVLIIEGQHNLSDGDPIKIIE